MPNPRFITLTFLIFIAVLILSLSVSATGTHGVNGHVMNCNPLAEPPFEVNGANVIFNLYYSNGTLKDTAKTLTDTVGYGKANASGWYAVDVGNFDEPWLVGDIVLINISKDSYTALTYVNLTEAGNDQAFTVCLGPDEWNWSCACGNNVCEWWTPLCENEEFEASGIMGINVITKRCPEDCGDCICGNGVCQTELCGENMTNCPEDCGYCICGNGICQLECGENSATCPEDCYCGNREINPPDEQCDGANWGPISSCEDFGFAGGALSCVNCQFDTSQCTGPSGPCGNGIINPGEQCDGANLGLSSCKDFGFAGGALSCVNCRFDTSQCADFMLYALCSDGICAGAETQENCCQDCGCPERKGCHVYKCTPEYKWRWFRKTQIGPYKCRELCCFIGYCCVWLGLCWHAWIIIIIVIAAAIIIYILTRPTLEKIARALAKIRKTKNLIAADKITKVNRFIK